jgi:cardiolipin synthase
MTLILFVIAGFSDGLDGFLAKRYGWQSRLGGLLDPLADKILFISTFLILGIIELIPNWLVGIAIARDLIIVSGTACYQLTVGNVEPAPSQISKLNTLLQAILVVIVILDVSLYPISQILLHSLQWSLLATLLLSGGHYIYLWGYKATVERGH